MQKHERLLALAFAASFIPAGLAIPAPDVSVDRRIALALTSQTSCEGTDFHQAIADLAALHGASREETLSSMMFVSADPEACGQLVEASRDVIALAARDPDLFNATYTAARRASQVGEMAQRGPRTSAQSSQRGTTDAAALTPPPQSTLSRSSDYQ